MTDNKSIISKSTEKFSDNYSDNPVAALLLTAISIAVPQVAIGKEAIDRAVTKIQKERFQTLLDELAKGEKLLTPEIIESEEFIHSFVVVYRAAINTYQRDKIRRFARILLTAVEEDELASDTFEEYTKILENISQRELWILSELRRLEMKWISHNSDQHTKSEYVFENAYGVWTIRVTMKVWYEFANQIVKNYNLDYYILQNTLKKLEGIGLYSGTEAHLYIEKNRHEIGTPTHLFEQFIKWIQLESEQDDFSRPDIKP